MVAFQLDPPTNGYIYIYFCWNTTACPILRPPDEKSPLIGKTLMLGKIEGRRRRGHHRLDGHEFEQAPRVLDGQGSPVTAVHELQRVGHD